MVAYDQTKLMVYERMEQEVTGAMTTDNANTDDAEWQARYAVARAILDNPTRMEIFTQVVARLADSGEGVCAVSSALPFRAAERIGLLAGSYNPLTLAHIAVAEAARRVAQLDLVAWALTAVTVDKERVTRASLPQRIAQLDAYIASTIGKVHYADALVLLAHGLYVEQAQAIRTLMPPDAELVIIVGYDKIVQIFDPRYYDDREAALQALFAQARLLVAPRDGQGEADLRALLARPENQPYSEYVAYCPLDPVYATDSSTEARQLAAPLTPDAVADSPALRRLLPPEGVALAATGTYALT